MDFGNPVFGYPSSQQFGEGGVDGGVVPRTGTDDRIVLTHYTGTRRVTFGVGNTWSLFPSDDRRVKSVLDANTWSFIRPGHESSVMSTQ